MHHTIPIWPDARRRLVHVLLPMDVSNQKRGVRAAACLLIECVGGNGAGHMLNLPRIEAAADRIRSAIYESPLVHSKMLSGLTGNSIYLKLENLQMTGSFKERGIESNPHADR